MNYNIYDKLREIDRHLEKNSNKKWMSIKEASAFSRLSISTLRRAISTGSLKASHTTGKLLLQIKEINRWLNG